MNDHIGMHCVCQQRALTHSGLQPSHPLCVSQMSITCLLDCTFGFGNMTKFSTICFRWACGCLFQSLSVHLAEDHDRGFSLSLQLV